MLIRTSLMTVLIGGLMAGCPMNQPETNPGTTIDLSDPNGLDGTWRITGGGSSGADCVSVANGQIVRRDGGCDGSEDEIVGSEPASIAGNRIVWTFASVVGDSPVPFTLDVTLQQDGTLWGTVSITDLSAGGVNSSEITMTRE